MACGHMTDVPPTITYASVVSHKTVRIACTIAAMNDFQVRAVNIMNAYVTVPCLKKVGLY